jgi:hypothetical protein
MRQLSGDLPGIRGVEESEQRLWDQPDLQMRPADFDQRADNSKKFDGTHTLLYN